MKACAMLESGRLRIARNLVDVFETVVGLSSLSVTGSTFIMVPFSLHGPGV
jgi:hypothetical protein